MAACGVGVSLGLNSNKEVEVTGLAPGGHALKSGKLRVGDVILQVDLKPVGKTVYEVSEMLKGKSGSMVSIQVRRAGMLGPSNVIETLKRDPIAQQQKQEGGKKEGAASSSSSESTMLNWASPFSILTSSAEKKKPLEGGGGDDIFGGVMRQLSGQNAGVGMIVGMSEQKGIFVKSLAPGGPAAKSGQLYVDDIILEVGGAKVGSSIDEVSNQIKGAAGSQVVFKIKRNEFIGSNVKTVTLTRQNLDASPQPKFKAQWEQERKEKEAREARPQADKERAEKERRQSSGSSTSKPAQGTPLQKGKTGEGENVIGDWFASLSSPSPAAKTTSNRPASGDWLGGIRSPFGGDAQDAASSGRPASASSPMSQGSATPQSRPSSQAAAAAAPPSPSVVDQISKWDILKAVTDAGSAFQDMGKSMADTVTPKVGVGITAGEKGKDKNKVVVVASVDAGSPAAKSQKIFVDDSIISIDHIQVSSAKQAHECLQGLPGKHCTLQLRRPGFLGIPETVTVSLRRPGGEDTSATANARPGGSTPSPASKQGTSGAKQAARGSAKGGASAQGRDGAGGGAQTGVLDNLAEAGQAFGGLFGVRS